MLPPLLFNLKFVLAILLLLNVLGVFLLRKNLQFIKGPLVLFVFLVLSFLTYRFLISPTQIQNIHAERNAQIKKQGWDYLGNPDLEADFKKQEKLYRQNNLLLLRLVGLQAAFSFIFSCIGLFISSDKKVYAVFALCFFILAYVYVT